MKNWSIAKRVAVTCGVLLTLLLAAGISGTVGIRKSNANIQLIMDDCVSGLQSLAYLKGSVGELRGDAMAAIVPGLGVVRAKNIAGVAKLQTSIPEMLSQYENTITAQEDRAIFARIKMAATTYLATCEKTSQLAEAGKFDEAAAFYGAEGRAQYSVLDKAIAEEVVLNARHAQTVYQTSMSEGGRSMAVTWTVMGLAVCAGLGLAAFVVSSIGRALRQSADDIYVSSQQVVSASGQLTSSSQSLAQGSSRQAATLEETSASSQEIGAMAARNSENTRQAVNLMQVVDTRVTEANQVLLSMSESMERIGSSSNEIAKIIKVIDEIAFQTNILALNAAVEAARAGEAGLGFSVVADEVRNLAQRSAQAAKDTTLLIESSVTHANTGVEKVALVRTVIGGVTQSASEIRKLVDELNGAATQQARGVEQISSALTQLEQITQSTAESAEQSASASRELKAQAESMDEIIASLRVLANGARA